MLETKTVKQTTSVPTMDILQEILEEIRSLKIQFATWFPFDNLNEYENSNEVKEAYEKAIRQYPPTL